MTFTSPEGGGLTLPLPGNIGADGIASGTTGGEYAGGNWTASPAFTCMQKGEAPAPEQPKPAEQAKPPGPDVFGEAILGGPPFRCSGTGTSPSVATTAPAHRQRSSSRR